MRQQILEDVVYTNQKAFEDDIVFVQIFLTLLLQPVFFIILVRLEKAFKTT